MIKLYLDNCCFNRPFDDQTQLIIRLETEAKLFIQDEIRKGIFQLAWSYILDFENEVNPFEQRRSAVDVWRDVACETVIESEKIIVFAKHLQKTGIKPNDSLHLSCAVNAKCDCFVTVDRKLLHRNIPEIKIFDPVAFIQEMENKYYDG